MFAVGDIWMWTRNSYDHQDDTSYNYFMILDNEWGYRVMYIRDGAIKWYTASSLEHNKDHLKFIA
jgi:hypothetical protein